MIPGMGGKNKAPAKIYDPAAAQVFENVPYASVSKSEVCDIYIPEGKGAFPVIMLVHGGGFAFENQRMSLMESVAKKAISEGYTIVAVDYRKSGEAQFPGALSDVKAAIWGRLSERIKKRPIRPTGRLIPFRQRPSKPEFRQEVPTRMCLTPSPKILPEGLPQKLAVKMFTLA